MSETIEQKLDRLAEFHSQKDSIEAQKRALLDDVKVPAEVLQVQAEANERAQAFQSAQYKAIDAIRAEYGALLETVHIPEEIRAQLAEIDKKRAEIIAQQSAKETELKQFADQKRAELFAEAQAKTAQVYADIAARKAEIEAEFTGKEQDADANIKALEAEIKAEVKAAGKSVKGKFFHAVYVKGRVTWNTDKMEAWIIDHPFLKEARKEGEPSITLRHI